MTFNFLVPTASEHFNIVVDTGTSVVIVGANGGGKTRLAVHIENVLQQSAHRISAHRALALNRLLKYPLRNRKATQGDFDFSDFLFAL